MRFTAKQVSEELQLELDRIEKWCEQELVFPTREDNEEFFVPEDLERFRVIKNLIDDLEVNEEGVEVILGMRDKMIGMEKWLREVFKILNEHQLLSEDLLKEFKKFS